MESDFLVVVGGSAGALRAVRRIVAGLPRAFPAAVVVVIHYPEDAPSSLAKILERSGPLSATTLRGEQPIVSGTIGVGPPGRHVVIRDHHTVLENGPRENGQRPSIDVLFRSAAAAYGARAIGVIVSGTLDDGAAGLAEIVVRGGRALVQSPSDADYDAMPLSAIRYAGSAEVAPAGEIAARLVAIVTGPSPEPVPAEPLAPRSEPTAVQTRLSCPECGSPLAETHEHPPAFRCRLGHAFTIGSLAEATHRAGETALWQALRTHDERVDILLRLEAGAIERRDHGMAETYRRLSAEAFELAVRLRAVIVREPSGRSVGEGGDFTERALVGDDAIEKVGDVRP